MNECLELIASGTLIVCAIAFARAVVASQRTRAGDLWRSICDACGYSTEGLIHTCPECGDYVRPAHLRTIDSSGEAPDRSAWRITLAILFYVFILSVGSWLLAQSVETVISVTRSTATVHLTPANTYHPTWRAAIVSGEAWRPSPQALPMPADRVTIVVYTSAGSALAIAGTRTPTGWSLGADEHPQKIPSDSSEYGPLLEALRDAARLYAPDSGLSSNDASVSALAAGLQENLGVMHIDAAATSPGSFPLGGVGPNRVQSTAVGTGATTVGAPESLLGAICVTWLVSLVIGSVYIARAPRATAPGALIITDGASSTS
jgi:hypothetical protein